jgi:integrase/recombinase XerC
MNMPIKRSFDAGEKQCAICGKALPAFETTDNRNNFACDNPECRRKLYSFPAPTVRVAANEKICDGPNCIRPIPAGEYDCRKELFFCGLTCQTRYFRSRHVVGTCLYCDGPIHDNPYMTGKRRFCCTDHQLRYYGVERLEERTGPFADILKMYLETHCKPNLAERTVRATRTYLIGFLGWLHAQGVSDLEGVDFESISRYIAHEDARGVKTRNYVNVASVFFDWLRHAGKRKAANPVVPRFHGRTNRTKEPRPYTEQEMNSMWGFLEADGTILMKVAFAIGEECGLRVGEVGNIRLEDLDQSAQRIFVRLPTKTRATRRPFYHDKVNRYLIMWLLERDAYCSHDHLLHNEHLRPITSSGYLQTLLREFFEKHGIAKFSFHRLRHTWATRLANSGVDPAIIMELGGWRSWAGMQRYIRLCQQHIEDSYHGAMERSKSDREMADESVISLADLALMTDAVSRKADEKRPQ